MDVKPFSLQSPESIAKEYGGDKRKIAQAIQLGIVDPTAGVVAGMFIDRMRSAAMQEQQAGPIPTVAQQTLAPQPAPPPPQQPPMAPPPMPQQGAQEGPPPPQVPPGSLPQTMADGGIASLGVPDDMYDSYANGGLVAFAEGGIAAPRSFMGLSTDPQSYMDMYDRLRGVDDDKYTKQYEDYINRTATPEARAKQKRRDLWETLAQVGFNLAATKSPNFMQAVGEAGAGALPLVQQKRAQRKAEERDDMRGLMAIEGQRKQERSERAKVGLEGSRFATEQANAYERNQADIASREKIAAMQESGALERTRMQVNATLGAAKIQAASSKATDMSRLVDIYYEKLKERSRQGTLVIPNTSKNFAGHKFSDTELRAMAAEMAYTTRNEAALRSADARVEAAQNGSLLYGIPAPPSRPLISTPRSTPNAVPGNSPPGWGPATVVGNR